MLLIFAGGMIWDGRLGWDTTTFCDDDLLTVEAKLAVDVEDLCILSNKILFTLSKLLR